MSKQIVGGIVTILIAGWITYVSVKGVSLDAVIAGVNTRVAVLETIATVIKEDITEIKMLMKEVRKDQMRTQKRGESPRNESSRNYTP